MTETWTRELLTELTTDEPYFVPDVDAAMDRGLRSRRRHRAAAVAAPLVAVVAVAGLAAGAQLAGQPASGSGGPQAVAAGAGSVTGAAATIKAAVEKSSPAGLDFSGLRQVADTRAFSLDGNVDDGQGKAWLWVSVIPAARSGSTARPCDRIEFLGNGECPTTRVLADGSKLSVQGPAGSNGFRTEMVVLVHRDGSAVVIEANNATVVPLPDRLLTAADQVKDGPMRITRPQPIYSTSELTAVAEAVDAATAAIR